MRRYSEEFYLCSYCGQTAHHIVVWGCVCEPRIWEAYACINHEPLFGIGSLCTCGKPLEILTKELPV